MSRQESRPPESAELDLTEHEGTAVMISGQVDSGWFYSAEVIDTAGPIISAIVEKLFQPTNP